MSADDRVPDLLTQLRYTDPAGRYRFVHARDWHVVGRTPDHLILRLLDKGEFVAQATVTTWKKAEPGRHVEPDDFKKAIAQLPGWAPEEMLADGPIPSKEKPGSLIMATEEADAPISFG